MPPNPYCLSATARFVHELRAKRDHHSRLAIVHNIEFVHIHYTSSYNIHHLADNGIVRVHDERSSADILVRIFVLIHDKGQKVTAVDSRDFEVKGCTIVCEVVPAPNKFLPSQNELKKRESLLLYCRKCKAQSVQGAIHRSGLAARDHRTGQQISSLALFGPCSPRL